MQCAANLCHVFWALAVILLAFAGFTVIVVRLRRPARAADEPSDATVGADQGGGLISSSSGASCTSAPPPWPCSQWSS